MECNNNPAFKQDTPCEVKIVLNPEIDIKIKEEILRIIKNSRSCFFNKESFHYLKSLLRYKTNQPDTIKMNFQNYYKPLKLSE